MLLCVLATDAAVTAEDYTPPPGFNGHAFNASLADFHAIRMWSVSTATGSTGKVTEFYFDCTQVSKMQGRCDPDVKQTLEGDGSYALGEYYFDTDRNPWAYSSVRLHAITYLFCAHWMGVPVPRTVRSQLRYCGNRIFYRSETTAQLKAMPEGFVSNHERVLKRLIDEHGLPQGYRRRGTITLEIEGDDDEGIEPEDGAPARLQDVQRYRWCGMPEDTRRLSPICPATITQVFDRNSGWGMIVFATAPVYAFAYARHSLSDENNLLYVLLNGRPIDQPFRRLVQKCTGTYICGGKMSALPERDQKLFTP